MIMTCCRNTNQRIALVIQRRLHCWKWLPTRWRLRIGAWSRYSDFWTSALLLIAWIIRYSWLDWREHSELPARRWIGSSHTWKEEHRECVINVLSRLQRNSPAAFRRALSLDRYISYCIQRMYSRSLINRVSRYMAMLTIFSSINIACRWMWIWWRTVFRCVWRRSWYGCRPTDSA